MERETLKVQGLKDEKGVLLKELDMSVIESLKETVGKWDFGKLNLEAEWDDERGWGEKSEEDWCICIFTFVKLNTTNLSQGVTLVVPIRVRNAPKKICTQFGVLKNKEPNQDET